MGLSAEEMHSVSIYVSWLIDSDRKSTALKSLQGKIWKAGYEQGNLRAPVFPDVVRWFERWRKMCANIAIFSSGSVLAQKMLFTHTIVGDLTGYIAAYFDTNIGAKIDAESYWRIAEQMARRPDEVLFISDSTSELDAAQVVGMQTYFSMRPGNRVETKLISHRIIKTFDQIFESIKR